jgi:ribosomal protein S27AE
MMYIRVKWIPYLVFFFGIAMVIKALDGNGAGDAKAVVVFFGVFMIILGSILSFLDLKRRFGRRKNNTIEPIVREKTKCPKCGAALVDSPYTCPKCGTVIQTEVP